MLKKKIHFLFINITINKKFINKNKQNKNLDFLHISLKNNINNLFNNIESSVDSVFKKFVFLGIALGLVNWEKFTTVSNLALNDIYWEFVEGYSFYGKYILFKMWSFI